MRTRFMLLVLGFTLACAPTRAGVFTGDWLELIDTSKLAMLRNDVTQQVSSYDRTGGNDDGFSGAYSFLRQQDDGSFVIFEDEGPGCVYRIWSANPGSRRIEFYFDGEQTPRLAFDSWEDMFQNKVEPFVAPISHHEIGGWCSYVPLPYAKSLKVVTRERVHFYQFTFTEFADGADVRTFTPEMTPEDREKFERVKTAWSNLGEDPWPREDAVYRYRNVDAAAGRNSPLMGLSGAGILTSLEIEFKQVPARLLRLGVLEINADGGSPEVEVPLGDFFLQGFPSQDTRSLLCGVKAGNPNRFYSFWPMPYEDGITVALRNDSEDKARLRIETRFVKFPEQPGNLGRFHARWLRQNPTTPGELFPILQANGRGHWCGVSMAMHGYGPGHGFLEGDEMLWIDGRDNTTFNGTGSEDYYNGGWYFGTTGSFPYYGCGYHAEPQGRCHAFRLHMTDLVPFQQSARIGIEHGHNNEVQADYAGTTFWYAAAQARAANPAMLKGLERLWRPVALPGYIEAEDCLGAESGGEAIEVNALDTTVSNGKAIRVRDGHAATLTLDVPADDVYQVHLRFVLRDGRFGGKATLHAALEQSAVWTAGRCEAPFVEKPMPPVFLPAGRVNLTLAADGTELLCDAIKLVASPKESGVVEAEGLPFEPFGPAAVERVNVHPGGMSGYAGLRIQHAGEATGVAFAFDTEIAGPYKITARLMQGQGRPNVQIMVDDQPVGEPLTVSQDHDGWQKALPYRITPVLEPGTHTFALVQAGSGDPGAESLVDYLRVGPEGWIEGESLAVVTAEGGPADPQEMHGWGGGWSGNSQLWFRPGDSAGKISLRFSTATAGPRNVCAYFTKAPDYGIYELSVDGQPVGAPYDGFNPGGVVRSEKICFGSVDLAPGEHTITFTCAGKCGNSTGFMLGLDALLLE